MSKKTLLAFNPLSKEVKILLLIDSSWLRQKSRGLIRDQFTEKKVTEKSKAFHLKKVFQIFYCKSEAQKVEDNLLYSACGFL